MLYTLDGLGGHLGRTSGEPSGYQTLWLGLVSLRYLVEGMPLASCLTLD